MYDTLDLTGNIHDIIMQMSEGNPGAMNALMDMAQKMGTEPKLFGASEDELVLDVAMQFTMFLLDLDDMNIRGPRIWVVFKDMHAFDHAAIFKAVSARDDKIVEHLNSENFHPQAPAVVKAGGSNAIVKNVMQRAGR